MNKRKWKSRLALLAAPVAVVGLLTTTSPGYALPAGIFELDGDTVDAAEGGDDWNTLYADESAPYGSSSAFTGVVGDPAGQSVFSQGDSKDDLDTDGWGHVSQSVPDKDEITNAYAAAYLAPDGDDSDGEQDLVVYFGADRFAQNGAAHIGTWFFQNKMGLNSDGTFSGTPHTEGDVLVLSNFTQGGTVSSVQVWKWSPGAVGPTCAANAPTVGCVDNDGNLQLLLASAAADCTTASPSANACAKVNGREITVPWPYDAKGGPVLQGKVPAGGFFEGGVNLSALFPEGTPCISSFLAETRSSPSIDATLKDFALGSFPLCSAGIQIAGTGVNEVGQQHTFTVTVNEVLGGASSVSDDAHVDVTLSGANGAEAVVDAAASTCDDEGPNVDANGQCTIVFSSSSTGTVTGRATASVPVGDTTIDVSTDGTAPNSAAVVKRFVDSRITLSPLTDTNGITENHVVTADVDVDHGDGAGFVNATSGHVDVKVTSSAGAAHTINSGGTGCHVQDPPDGPAANNLDGAGQCTVAFTSGTTGTVTVNATVNLSLTTDQGTQSMTRATGTGGNNSADATKDFVDGSLRWTKHDDQAALLAGATFEVCRTHNFDSATNSQADITDVCFSVTDDELADEVDATTPDADDVGGEFLVEGLVLGRYTVRETVAPTGYQLDPDVETVDLTVSGTSGSVATPFVDPQLFKLLVITCNTATERLVDGTVTLPGTPGDDTRETLSAAQLPSGVTEEQVCGLPGASYDDVPRGTYSPSVELPDQPPAFP